MDKETLHKMIEFLLPRPEEEDEIENGAMKLASAGWALCPLLSPKDLQEIGDTDKTNDEIDRFMLDFYTSNDGFNLDELVKKNLLQSPGLSDWKITITQSKSAYDAELFYVVVPALITIVEGFLSKLVGTFDTSDVRLIRPTKEKANDNHQYRLDKSIWLTISVIIEQLFQRSNFSEAAPEQLNRHWVMHGRHTPIEAKNDSIKLFNLIGAMSLTIV